MSSFNSDLMLQLNLTEATIPQLKPSQIFSYATLIWLIVAKQYDRASLPSQCISHGNQSTQSGTELLIENIRQRTAQVSQDFHGVYSCRTALSLMLRILWLWVFPEKAKSFRHNAHVNLLFCNAWIAKSLCSL